MNHQLGVWIDTHKAVLIRLSGDQNQIKTIESEIDTRERISGETKKFARFGEQFTDFAKRKSRKLEAQKKNFLQLLINEIKESEQVVVFGPAEMKFNLEKEIHKNKKLTSRLKGVEVADNMTENQMKAWVRNFYDEIN